MTAAYMRWVAESVAKPLVDAYRRTGADVPFGDPVPSHGCEMEGWFWRLTDSASGRVVVALCSVNRNRDADWATVAVALHPGGIVRSAALDDAETEYSRFTVHAGTDPSGRLAAGVDDLQIDLDDIHLNLRFADPFIWPKALGGGGIFSSIPFLNQYWHPYRLGGKASGTVEFGGETWTFDDAPLYAERNWGAGFPERWWWGQAHDFGGDDVSVAFSGGLLQLGPLRSDVTGVVVRLGDRVIRMTPPALVRSQLSDGRWTVRARTPRYQIDLDGDGTGLDPHVLPVPLPAERRNIDNDFEHLAGRLHCTVRKFGRVVFDGTCELAGLEVGSRPPLT
jgi:tocopherol cyclase